MAEVRQQLSGPLPAPRRIPPDGDATGLRLSPSSDMDRTSSLQVHEQPLSIEPTPRTIVRQHSISTPMPAPRLSQASIGNGPSPDPLTNVKYAMRTSLPIREDLMSFTVNCIENGIYLQQLHRDPQKWAL